MVLTCIKNIVVPTRRDGEHQRLLEAERGQQPSVNSGTFTNGFGDKQDDAEVQPLARGLVSARVVSDATIGLSDGLTVPFALTAGLSALGTTNLVIYAGFAELVAGSISMGLGGYLGAKSEADAYFSALQHTKELVTTNPAAACDMARSTFQKYDISELVLNSLIKDLERDSDNFVDFVMKFHYQLAEADFTPSRAYASGFTIASGYFLGGLVPLLPYLFFEHIREALSCSIIVMAIALFAFGWLKTSAVGERSRWVCFQNATQMLILGTVAAGAAMGCVKAIGG